MNVHENRTMRSLNLMQQGITRVFRNTFYIEDRRLNDVNLTNNARTNVIEKSLFEKLEALYLVSNSIRIIHKSTFNHLANLKVLDLSNNLMVNIDAGLFKGLICLQELILNHNSIGILNVNTFLDLSNLKSLDLSCNQLSELRPNTFQSIVEKERSSKLQFLNLIENRLKRVCANGLKYLTWLEELYLGYNEIVECNPNAFQDLVTLSSLFLDNNRLKIIDSRLFQKLHQLELLYLNNNRIEEVVAYPKNGLLYRQDDRFFHCQQLYVINLANNRLIRINKGMFQSLDNLAFLDLSSNEIEELEEGCFDDLHSLEFLRIDNNRIEDIDRSLFENLNSIELLTIFNNNFCDDFVSFVRNRFKTVQSEIVRKVFILIESNKYPHLDDWDQFRDQF